MKYASDLRAFRIKFEITARLVFVLDVLDVSKAVVRRVGNERVFQVAGNEHTGIRGPRLYGQISCGDSNVKKRQTITSPRPIISFNLNTKHTAFLIEKRPSRFLYRHIS